MVSCLVDSIYLQNVRNHKLLSLKLEPAINTITGDNGSGKTSVLEAVSLLYPGRGIREANIEHIRHKQNLDPMCIKASVFDGKVTCKIQLEYDDKKTIKINDKKTKSQQELTDHVHLVYATPQLHHKITTSKTGKRNFLDRLTYLLHPDHAATFNLYDKTIRERNEILKHNAHNHVWLESVERNAAHYGAKLMHNRQNTLNQLRQTTDRIKQYNIGHLSLSVSGEAELQMQSDNIEAMEQTLQELYARQRHLDIIRRRTTIGPHNTQFNINITSSNDLPIEQCSIGEQKTALITIIIMQIIAKQKSHNINPILLLDDITAQLDNHKIQHLFNIITDLNCQTLITAVQQPNLTPAQKEVNHNIHLQT